MDPNAANAAQPESGTADTGAAAAEEHAEETQVQQPEPPQSSGPPESQPEHKEEPRRSARLAGKTKRGAKEASDSEPPDASATSRSGKKASRPSHEAARTSAQGKQGRPASGPERRVSDKNDAMSAVTKAGRRKQTPRPNAKKSKRKANARRARRRRSDDSDEDINVSSVPRLRGLLRADTTSGHGAGTSDAATEPSDFDVTNAISATSGDEKTPHVDLTRRAYPNKGRRRKDKRSKKDFDYGSGKGSRALSRQSADKAPAGSARRRRQGSRASSRQPSNKAPAESARGRRHRSTRSARHRNSTRRHHRRRQRSTKNPKIAKALKAAFLKPEDDPSSSGESSQESNSSDSSRSSNRSGSGSANAASPRSGSDSADSYHHRRRRRRRSGSSHHPHRWTASSRRKLARRYARRLLSSHPNYSAAIHAIQAGPNGQISHRDHREAQWLAYLLDLLWKGSVKEAVTIALVRIKGLTMVSATDHVILDTILPALPHEAEFEAQEYEDLLARWNKRRSWLRQRQAQQRPRQRGGTQQRQQRRNGQREASQPRRPARGSRNAQQNHKEQRGDSEAP